MDFFRMAGFSFTFEGGVPGSLPLEEEVASACFFLHFATDGGNKR